MEKVKKGIKKYWNWRSKSFLTDRSVTIEKKWESILKELVSASSGRLALDIGTGKGHFAVYLARLGFSVTGIDLSENMIFCARQNAAEHSLDIDFQTGDAEKLESRITLLMWWSPAIYYGRSHHLIKRLKNGGGFSNPGAHWWYRMGSG